MISDIELKCFQIKFDVGIVYVFKVGIIIIIKKNYSLKITFFFSKFLISNFWQVLCVYIYP
jgi:hypothetical protein